MYDSEFERLSHGLLVNPGFRGETRNGSISSSSLVLDSERGELLEATVKLQREGVSADRSIAALRNHSEAEAKRRARINAHLDTLRGLIPGAKKMDKASLLTEVMRHLKELKRSAAEASEGILIPLDIDEVIVEQQKDGLSGNPFSVRASLCCDYQPGLLFDLRRALDSLDVMITSAEIATLGGRIKNIFVITSSAEGNFEDNESTQSLAASVHQALTSVLDRFSALQEFTLRTTLSNKRRRISLFNSSLSSSS
ncbi:HLH domain-containing protein [Cephalotus follicularis]|uniref:HLH domain-containing protein n=1 Tax=Cephalotus follicularis TaxID=3775 RepID=A0A1Q3AWM2_CEPFO|nr:HLH domain-containing protein [Cephalotus follicularis]